MQNVSRLAAIRRGRSVRARVSKEEGVVPGQYFLVSTKLDTFCYLTVQTAPCYVPSFWHNTCVWQTVDGQTDMQTDGIAVASAALAMRALRRAVKMGVVCHHDWSESEWTVLLIYLISILLCQQMLDAILNALLITILSFSKTVQRCILHSAQWNCCSAKLSTSPQQSRT